MRRLGIWALLAVVVIGGAWYVVTHPRSEIAPAPTEWTLSASFACADSSYFVAAFPTGESVSILVDGEVVRIVPLTAGIGQRYEDNDYAYVFAGEEVTVTTKATGAVTTCTQPFDPNNAPVNFGDAGEGGGERPDAVLVVSESILGTWKSNEDPLFVREFTEDGKVADLYSGQVTATGSWSVFTSANPKDVSFPIEEDAVYIQIVDTMGTLNYKLTKLTPETLELIYMDRGGSLTFTRVP